MCFSRLRPEKAGIYGREFAVFDICADVKGAPFSTREIMMSQKMWAGVVSAVLKSGVFFAVVLLAFLGTPAAWAQQPGEFTVFQKTYVREAGAPETVTDTFSVFNPNTSWQVQAINGDLEDDTVEMVSSSRLEINGEEVLAPNQFNQNVNYVEEPVSLVTNNTVSTIVKGKPGGQLIVSIVGEDNQSPVAAWEFPVAGSVFNTSSIAAQLHLSDDTAGLNPVSLEILLNNNPVTGAFTPLTASVLDATLSASLTDLADGSHTLSAYIEDLAGNTHAASVTFTVDRTLPVVGMTAPEDGAVTHNFRPEIIIHYSDALSGIDPASAQLIVNGADVTDQATIRASQASFTPAVDLNAGLQNVAVSVSDNAGNTANASFSFTVQNLPPVADAGANQSDVGLGVPVNLDGSGSYDPENDPFTYAWAVVDAPEGSAAFLSDETVVNPSFTPDQYGTYIFELVVHDGRVSSASDTVQVTTVPVPQEPVVSIEADPPSIQPGHTTILSWTSTDAETCEIQPGIGSVDTTGSVTVSPIINTTYTITVTGVGGTATASVTVIVEGLNPSVTLSANPASIPAGGSAVLSFSSMNAYQVYLDQGIGEAGVSGSVTVTPEHTTVYTATAVGPNGIASAQVLVSVEGNPAPQPAGSFGSNYNQLVPPDATISEYDPQKFAVIRGQVKDINNNPLSEVLISVNGHAEYGTTATDINGGYSLPVEGGATLNVVFRKQGFVTAHRTVTVLFNDIAVVQTPVLLAEDQEATTLTLDGDPQTVVTHRSRPLTDSFGTRRATLVFTGDTQVFAVDENGDDLFALTTMTVRATQVQNPESMPAVLPPTTSYTHCVELSVDGVARVRFSQPVMMWVENFLGFALGDVVPVGYYDRQQGEWIASENGWVVILLDQNSDGIVDALDMDGDNAPDDLDSDGDYADEVLGLSDPGQYTPGTMFWRVPIPHFTPWDCNWPSLPEEGSTDPNARREANVDQQKDECHDQPVPADNPEDSYVNCRSRVYHEDIPVAGTGLTLHYSTNRASGYQTVINVPASGSTVPTTLKYIIVRLEIAGLQFEQTLPALPDQQAEFVWDGLDYLGQRVLGPTAKISVGFAYEAVYFAFGNNTPSLPAFGQPGTIITEITAQQEIISWQQYEQTVYNTSALPGMLAEGWSLSNHHYIFISPDDSRLLFKGDGVHVASGTPIITTVAGNGNSGNGNGPDPLAVMRAIGHVAGVTADAAGNFYFALDYSNRVFKVDLNGIISHVAGNGVAGYGGDGGPAVYASLYNPRRLTMDSAGNLYIADMLNHRIRKIDPNGIITTVAGNGTQGFSGDNGPATSARLNKPSGIAVDNAGNLYIADSGNYKVRKVDTNGIITSVTGSSLFYDENGQPVGSGVVTLRNVIVDTNGNIYVAIDIRIRKVDTNGIITTVAGRLAQPGDIWVPSGDGGPATDALLIVPDGLALDVNGNLYISSNSQYASVRKVDINGIITTVAGTGLYGYSGDNGPATKAQLGSGVMDVAVDNGGSFYIADTGNMRVRKVDPSQNTAFILSSDPSDNQFLEDGVGYIFASDGRHKETIDLNTGTVLETFGYDANGRWVSVTDRFGNQVTIERNASGEATAVISPDGIRTDLVVNMNNHLYQVRYPDTSAFTFVYTTGGLMTRETEPNGNFFTHTFDANGRIITAEDQNNGQRVYGRMVMPDGDTASTVTTSEGNLTTYFDQPSSTDVTTSASANTAVYARSASGLSTQVTQPNAAVQEYVTDYDPKFRVQYLRQSTATTPAGLTAEANYTRLYEDTNSDGDTDRITRTASLNAKTTTVVQDLLTSQTTATSPEGRTVTTEYDPATLLTSRVTVPGLLDTTYSYDTRGRVTNIQTGTRETVFTYDAQGNVFSILDPENHLTTFEYDALGRTTAIHRPDTTDIYYTYDLNGNMTVITNPSGIDHDFQYNLVNLADEYTPPLSNSTTYTYDRDRRLTRTTFPSGQEIVNVYTGDQLTAIQTPEGDVALSYYPSGQAQAVSKTGEQIAYSYDGSLLTAQALSGTLNQTLSYTYNNNFNLTGFTYAGATAAYTYDDDGLLTQASGYTITNNAANGLPEGVYDAVMGLNRSFNGYGEVNSQSVTVNGAPAVSWSVTHNNNGQIITKTETVAGVTANYAYSYDEVGRLTRVEKDGVLVEEYQYNDANPLGIRTYEMNVLRGIAGRSLSYNIEDQILSVGSAVYQYNLDGFLRLKVEGADSTVYDYSSRGELLSVNLPSGNVIEYVHDPLGRRIAKRMNGSITEKYLWSGLTRLLAVYDGANNLLMRFEYADARMPLAMTVGANRYYLAYDQVGSLRAVTDSAGSVIKRVDYDTFGNILSDSNPAFKVPFGFAGGLHDRDTGLIRFGARDYDPAIGRWTAKDPKGFAGGDDDLYGYTLDDPVNGVDPEGLWTIQIGVNGTFGIGGALTYSAGIIIGYSNRELQFGVYTQWGGGALLGGVVGVDGEVSWSLNPNIEDVQGTCSLIGGSTGTPVVGPFTGYETAIPVPPPSGLSHYEHLSYPTHTGHWGFRGAAPFPSEGHDYFTRTDVWRLWTIRFRW
jgi:RHS repeat-associated protein